MPGRPAALEQEAQAARGGPSAVELVDRTMIGLAREIAAFEQTVDAFIKGEPDAILLVEFSGEELAEQVKAGKLDFDVVIAGCARDEESRAVGGGQQAARWECDGDDCGGGCDCRSRTRSGS